METNIRIKHLIKAVIFDMDGTLVDSEEHWPDLTLEAYRAHLPPLPNEEEKLLGLLGLGVEESYRYLQELGLQMDHAAFVQLQDDTAKEVYLLRTQLFPGVKECLISFAAQNAGLALASSSPAHWVKMVLDRFALHPFFPVVVSGSEVPHSKPDPAIFLLAARRLGIAPQQCLVIEDSSHGVSAARAAGMLCLAVTNTLPREKLSLAHWIVNTLAGFTLEQIGCALRPVRSGAVSH